MKFFGDGLCKFSLFRPLLVNLPHLIDLLKLTLRFYTEQCLFLFLNLNFSLNFINVALNQPFRVICTISVGSFDLFCFGKTK